MLHSYRGNVEDLDNQYSKFISLNNDLVSTMSLSGTFMVGDCHCVMYCVQLRWPKATARWDTRRVWVCVYVGVNLEIWWCPRAERKYLQCTKGLRTIIKMNKCYPPTGKNRIERKQKLKATGYTGFYLAVLE